MLRSLFSDHRRRPTTVLLLLRHLSSSPLPDPPSSSSTLFSKYSFTLPPSLSPKPLSSQNPNPNGPNSEPVPKRPKKPPYKPPSSLAARPASHSDLPFDFRYSYTESSPDVKPIGLREPKYTPFGPGRLDRDWTGVCAPAVDIKVKNVEPEEEGMELMLEVKRKRMRGSVQGKELTNAEKKILVEKCAKGRTKKQVNLGRDGLTHNMLNDIHNVWKHEEAVRIKCMGVSTVDMKNICTQLEDKAFGKIIHRHGGFLVLYRGRNYNPKKRPKIPLMLWKPHEPVYPRLIKTAIDGLSIEETKAMRKKGLAVPALTKLARNGYYGSLVAMVRDAFLTEELVRVDCKGLDKSDHKKIGVKLRDLVPCILVTFEKEQIVVWRGKNYQPKEDGFFLPERDSFECVGVADSLVLGA